MQSVDLTEPRPKTRREEYMEATRKALIAEARDAFAEHGFGGASAEAISRAARVTRGAFYHHFANKVAIFEAVVVAMQAEAVAEIAKAAMESHEAWAMLEAGIDTYLNVCTRSDYARIVVLEASSILGVQRFHQIDESYVGALLQANIAMLIDRGEISFQGEALMLARAIDAVICRVATLMVDAPNNQAIRREGLRMTMRLIRGLAVQNSG